MPAADRPLAPWRVLVTRPEDSAALFAAALSAAGATPIIYPTITVGPPPSWQPLDEALDRIGRLGAYSWAIFASPSAVAFTLRRLAERQLPAQLLAGVRLAAVGDETARALAAAGLEVSLLPRADQQRQEGLLEALLSALPPPAGEPGGEREAVGSAMASRILFPQALGGRELLRDELARRGYAVDVVPVSQTVARALAVDPPPPFDVATFASPSALRAFVAELGVAPLAPARVAVIGPTTAEAAAALNVRVDAMPPTPSVAALVQCLIQLRAQLGDDDAP